MKSSPPIPTMGMVKKGILSEVSRYLAQKSRLTIVDLGSGWGTLLLPLAAQFPQHTFIGIEKGFTPYLVSKLRAKKYKNIHIFRQDIFKTDIRDADVILLFLLPHVMKKMADKFQHELKKGTLIYTNRFTLPNFPVHKKFSYGCDYESFYVYKIN